MFPGVPGRDDMEYREEVENSQQGQERPTLRNCSLPRTGEMRCMLEMEDLNRFFVTFNNEMY